MINVYIALCWYCVIVFAKWFIIWKHDNDTALRVLYSAVIYRISTTKFDVGNVIVGCLHDLQEETENFNLVVLKLRFVNCIFLSAHPSTNSRQRQKSCSYIISVFFFQHVLRNTGLGHNWLNKLVEQYKAVFSSCPISSLL